MLDEGYNDHKIIAIPFREPSWSEYESIEDLPKHIMEEIAHFFTIYKSLEGKETAVVKNEDAKAAKKVIKESVDAYRRRYLPHSQGR